MASILAIVSKKVFDRDFRIGGGPAGLGDVVPTTTYASTHAALTKLADGGDMFLVTVAPGEELWLAGVLASPKFAKDKWVSASSTTPITNITHLIPQLKFENGKGLTARAGALAMSLQTPRTLSEEDVALLRAATGIGGAKARGGSDLGRDVGDAKPRGASDVGRAKVRDAAPKSAAPKGAAPKGAAPKGAAPKGAAPKSAPKSAAPKSAPKSATRSDASSSSAAPVFAASPSDSPLARAGRHLEQGAYVEALDDLLAAWALRRSAEVADLIDDLGAHLASALPPIEGKKTTIDGAWRDVADQVRPVDVPRLLKAFEGATSGQIEGWLDVFLDRFPIDPRMCAVAIDTSVKFVASSAGPTRTRANKLAEKVADGRCIPQIDRLIAKKTDAWNDAELRDRLRKMRAKFAPPPALAKEEKLIVAGLAKQIAQLEKLDLKRLTRAKTTSTDDGARLLAEVLADPEAEAPRMVYMDWLQQRGDPRGEVMALPADDERAVRLVKQHGKSWLGPLAAVVSEPEFERGFLVACTVKLASKKQRDELLQHPLWATVKHVRCEERIVIGSPAMKSLRSVTGLSIGEYAELAKRKDPIAIEAIEGLECEDSATTRLPWETLVAVGAFEKLRMLGIKFDWRMLDRRGVEPAGWEWLLGSKLGKQLAKLHLDFGREAPSITSWSPVFAGDELVLTVSYDLGNAATQTSAIVRRKGEQLAYSLELLRPIRPQADEVRWEVQEALPLLFAGLVAPRLDVVVTTKLTKAELGLLEQYLAGQLGERFETITVAMGPSHRAR